MPQRDARGRVSNRSLITANLRIDLQVAVPSLCFVSFEFSLWVLDLGYLYFARIFIQLSLIAANKWCNIYLAHIWSWHYLLIFTLAFARVMLKPPWIYAEPWSLPLARPLSSRDLNAKTEDADKTPSFKTHTIFTCISNTALICSRRWPRGGRRLNKFSPLRLIRCDVFWLLFPLFGPQGARGFVNFIF